MTGKKQTDNKNRNSDKQHTETAQKMKTIKSIALTLIATITLVGLLFGATHQTSAQVVVLPSGHPATAEQIAAAYAGQNAEYYRGNYNFTGVTNKSSKFIYADYILQLVRGRWGITQLSINDVEIPIDPASPLWELPAYNAGEVQDFGMNIHGYDKNGQQVRYGYFNKSRLAKGEDIVLTIYLNSVRKFIPFQLTGSHNGSNTGIQSSDGQNLGWYDASLGGFVIYIDPINPPDSVLIVDLRNNGVISTIPFGPGGNGGSNGSSGFGFALENQGGSGEAWLSRDYSGWFRQFGGLKCDQVIVRGGTNYYGRATIVHTENSIDHLQIYAYSLKVGSRVEVFGRGADGMVKKVSEKTLSASDWGYITLLNSSGYTDYIITVIGLPSDILGDFNLYLYNSGEGTWSDGKGKVVQ